MTIGPIVLTTRTLASTTGVSQAALDIALALYGIGPNGSDVLKSADFVALDDLGRPMLANISTTNGDGTRKRATLLVSLDRSQRSVLCQPNDTASPRLPVKVTLYDGRSGMSTQATLSAGWCAR